VCICLHEESIDACIYGTYHIENTVRIGEEVAHLAFAIVQDTGIHHPGFKMSHEIKLKGGVMN
jgi:hypothetical protein